MSSSSFDADQLLELAHTDLGAALEYARQFMPQLREDPVAALCFVQVMGDAVWEHPDMVLLMEGHTCLCCGGELHTE